MTAYFILLSRETADSPWKAEFGDYGRETVEFELDDFVEGSREYKRKNLKIVRVNDDSQDAIDAVVAAHNVKF